MPDYVERTRQAFEAFNRRDFEVFAALAAPDIEWTPPAELPGSTTYRGVDGVREALGELIGVFEDLQAEAVRFIDLGDRLVGLYRWHASAPGSDASIDPFEIRAGFICDFENDLAKRVRFWTSWEATLEEAGIKEGPGTSVPDPSL